MSKANRQRRLGKRRRQHAAAQRRRAPSRPDATVSGGQRPDDSARRPPGAERPGGHADATAVRRWLLSAASAHQRRLQSAVTELLAILDREALEPHGRRLVEQTLDACLHDGMRSAWQRGWQPADVVRVVERRLAPPHARCCIDVIASDARRFSSASVDRRWADQLQQLQAEVWWEPTTTHLGQWAAREGMAGVDALRCGVELLSVVTFLPDLPRLCDPPGEPGSTSSARSARRSNDGNDARILDRVRALLAKAESTTFVEEAEAFTAKAQQLMARHAIDRAMVDATSSDHGDGPGGIRLAVDNPYASGKSLLLSKVASANRCRAVWSKELGFSTVLGFEADLDAVELLYTSVLVQATTAMVAAGSQVDRYGRSRTRSFRQSFLVAYAQRIGERLREAQKSSEEAAAHDYGEALLPVLASQSAVVDDAFASAFPDAVNHSYRVANQAGVLAGFAAAELARLSPHQEVRSKVG